VSENKEIVYFATIIYHRAWLQKVEGIITVPKDTKWAEIIKIIEERFSNLGDGGEFTINRMVEKP